MVGGCYGIQAGRVEVTGVFTNTTPVDAYRGAGRPEALFLLERIVDILARKLKKDPADIRRKNFIPADKFPYATAMGLTYDSGNYAGTLEKALDKVGYEKLRKEQAEGRRKGKLIGIGLSTYVEICGLGPSAVVTSTGFAGGLWGASTVRLHPTGKATVYTGGHPHGQGEETTFAQIVGDELGLPVADIEVVHGDTKLTPYGQGTYGSRTTPVEGGSIALSARKVKDKARKIAAHLLEAREEDLEFADGKFVVKGSPKAAKTIQEIAWAAYMAGNMPKGVEPVLDATTFYDPTNFVFPFGCHICVVDVDRETGQVKIRRYVAVDDVGNQINPMIVEGQVHGGVLQGLAQAMLEQSVYDENGNLLTNSLIEYLVPTALEAPRIETDSTVTPSPHNPLGVKGVGETGTIASSQAYVNAVRDAPVDDIVVVLGHEADRVRDGVSFDGAHAVVNPAYIEGMSTSLQAGIRAADPRSDGFLIVLGDQPFVQSATINTLIERRNRSQAKILIPTYGGARGNPILLDRSLSEDVQSITGDQGCRAIFGHHTGGILEVPVDDPGILVDLDTPEQITRAEEVVRTGRSIEGLVAMTEHDRSHSHPPGGAMRIDILQVAQDLRARNEPFVLATVVRVERPSSGRPGFKAIVRANRDLVGWLGGSCAQSVLVAEGLRALRDGMPRLMRLTPTPGRGPPQEGVVEYIMECASGGTMDIYLEPHLPKPQLLVVGDSPVAKALLALGHLLDYRTVLVTTELGERPSQDADLIVQDLARIPEIVTPETYAVVATMGKYDGSALQVLAGSQAIYVGLVASRRRAAAVLATLSDAGLDEPARARIVSPAGLDLSAKTPEEIALSIVAQIIQVRRTSAPPELPVPNAAESDRAMETDVVCGMQVDPDSPIPATHSGRTFLFCSEGCRARFLETPEAFS